MLYENEVGLKGVFWSFSIESGDIGDTNPIDEVPFSESYNIMAYNIWYNVNIVIYTMNVEKID